MRTPAEAMKVPPKRPSKAKGTRPAAALLVLAPVPDVLDDVVVVVWPGAVAEAEPPDGVAEAGVVVPVDSPLPAVVTDGRVSKRQITTNSSRTAAALLLLKSQTGLDVLSCATGLQALASGGLERSGRAHASQVRAVDALELIRYLAGAKT